MIGLREIVLCAAMLGLGACAKKTPPAPAVPAAPVAAPVAAPIAPVVAPPARRVPRPKTPRGTPSPVPVPPTSVPPRAPVNLESSADPVPDRALVNTRIRETQAVLVQLNSRSLEGAAKADRDRVAAMLDLAQRSLGRGDLRQANDLSGRAAVLANTILNAQ